MADHDPTTVRLAVHAVVSIESREADPTVEGYARAVLDATADAIARQAVADTLGPIKALADELIREGNRDTRRRAYPTGVALRSAGNRLRAAIRAAEDGAS